MDEQYEGTVPRRRRKRKLRLGRVLFTITMLLFLAIGFYTYVQYNSGKSLANENTIKPGSFTGDAVDPRYASVENYLLLGVDDDGSGKSRTDTMMVLSWNKSAGTMKIVSFMRDIYADIPGYKSYKLNTAYYLNGVQLIKDTLTGMFGIPIHHYAILDFENFESIVDIAFPKGVEIDVKKEMSENIDVTLMPGKKQLSGKELLGYARFRADSEGDFGRVARQQEVMSAIKAEISNPSILFRAPKVVGALSGYMKSDLSSKDELSRALSFLMKKGASVESLTIPIENSYSFKSYKGVGDVIELDVDKNQQAIMQFLGMQID